MAALREAAARGVRVRVLVDGMNARLNLQGSAALQELAAAENVEVRLYNPVDLLRPGEINYRMHDKYILVDGSLCLLGGRNTNDRFLSRTGQAENDDRDVLVYAPQPDEHCAVRQLENYFAAIWSLEETRPVTGGIPAARRFWSAMRPCAAAGRRRSNRSTGAVRRPRLTA